MNSSIFSTYSQGENRVTSTIISVLRRLPLDHSERLIAALLEQTEFQMVKFQNQPSKGYTGVPDAKISSHFDLLIETKIKKNMINNSDQILRHLQGLDKNSANQFLLVLTPDQNRPQIIEELIHGNKIAEKHLTWTPFTMLDQAVNELLNDEKEVVSERDTFLLKQLQIMMSEEALLEFDKDILVVAANRAWPEYQKLHAYVCQPERSFQTVKYMAFYSDGEIKPLIPKILSIKDNIKIEFIPDAKKTYQHIVNSLIDENMREKGNLHKILLLSDPDSKDTKKLSQVIRNDLRASSGRGIAFTQGQRYISSKCLKNAKTTSDLLKS